MRPVFFFPQATILDCGASRTTLAIFRSGKAGRLILERFATANFLIEPGQEESWLEKTTATLASLRTQVEPRGPLTVVLPPHLSLMKMLSTPRVDAAKRDKIINFESQQSIPYPLSEVAWDRLITGESAHSFEVLLCAAKLEALDPLCAALVAAGMQPSLLLPSVQAIAVSGHEAKAAAAASILFINMGARSTTFVVSDDTGYQVRTLALGGNAVTQQLAETMASDFAHAEEMKLDPARGAEILPAIRLFAGRLAQEITRTLVHFRRPLTAENPMKIVLTGGAAQLPALCEMLATQLNVPVSLFDVTGAIEFGRDAGEGKREANIASLADLFGAAALQLRAGPIALNLLPPRWRQQAGRRRLRPWLAVATGFAVAAIGHTVAHQHTLLEATRAKRAELERELVPLRVEAGRREKISQQAAAGQRQLDAGRKLENARSGWIGFLRELEAKFRRAGNAWLEKMQALPLPPTHQAIQTTEVPLRLAFTGVWQPPAGTEANREGIAYEGVRQLLEDLATMPQVAAVEGERFEPAPAGRLRFDFVVVLKTPLAL